MKYVLGFIIFLLSLSARSEPKINTKFNFYAIYPKSLVDIKRELKDKTTAIFNGKRFYGETSWYINWKFKFKEGNGNCQIYAVKTALSVEYIMPKIPDNFTVDPNIRNSFEKYYQALLKHEQGHKSSGLHAAQEIEKKLSSINTFRNCQKLENFANKKAKSIIKKYDRHDREYDERTDHGRLEGVDVDLYI